MTMKTHGYSDQQRSDKSMNNITAYNDGYKIGLQRDNDNPEESKKALTRAISDCQEMGWFYLKAYFEGKLAGINERIAKS